MSELKNTIEIEVSLCGITLPLVFRLQRALALGSYGTVERRRPNEQAPSSHAFRGSVSPTQLGNGSLRDQLEQSLTHLIVAKKQNLAFSFIHYGFKNGERAPG